MITRSRTTTRFAVLLGVAAFALTGCATSAPVAAETAPAGQTMTISDAWVKSAASGMSAAFGELRNSSGQDVTVVSATTAASPMVELHETVVNDTGETVMRQKEGGFVIPAGATFDLEPGGSHIMLMGLAQPLEAGSEVQFTLTFSDDSTYEFTAPVKDYSGANENYEGGDMGMDH